MAAVAATALAGDEAGAGDGAVDLEVTAAATGADEAGAVVEFGEELGDGYFFIHKISPRRRT